MLVVFTYNDRSCLQVVHIVEKCEYNDGLLPFDELQQLSCILAQYTSQDKSCWNDNMVKRSYNLSTNRVDTVFRCSVDAVYHQDGLAYDYYSSNEQILWRVDDRWKIWPLPNNFDQTNLSAQSAKFDLSPSVPSRIPFLDTIYVISDYHLTDRQKNFKKVLYRQGITTDLIRWRMTQKLESCNDSISVAYVYKKLNLENQRLGKIYEIYQKLFSVRCA